MGAEQSSSKTDKEYERRLQTALVQQRKIYEEKCMELLQEQQKTKDDFERLQRQHISQSSRIHSTIHTNAAPLYPNLQQDQAEINIQPSTSGAHYSTFTGNPPLQNQTNNYATFHYQPSAPIAPENTSITKTAPSIQKNRQIPKNANNKQHQCPSCKINFLHTNIFLCQDGHSSCNQCKIKAVKCGICKSSITNTRNIDLERILEPVKANSNNKTKIKKVNCPNKSDGCHIYLNPEVLPNHLKKCLYREMECPIASAMSTQCSWRGKINHLRDHILEYHPNQTGFKMNTEMIFDLIHDCHIVHHVTMGNINFLVQMKLDSNLKTLYMTIQVIGTVGSAYKWTYEFHVYNKCTPHRMYIYGDSCTSNTILFCDLVKDYKCASLPLKYALSLGQKKKLPYKFYIKKEESRQRLTKPGTSTDEVEIYDD